jgi:hypothetical protein
MNLIQLSIDEMRGEKPPIEPIPSCWIAGGAVRRWFNGGEKLSDVDVFGVSPEALDIFKSEKLSKFKEVGKNVNALTLTDGDIRVQLINGKPFPTVEAMIHKPEDSPMLRECHLYKPHETYLLV